MSTIVLASNNPHKLEEIQTMLADFPYHVVPQNELDVTEVAETGLSFVENAIIKARNACQQSQLPALADDSGLVVDALGGAPGIYSARYAGVTAAGENADSTANITKLLQAMVDAPSDKRSARFYAVMVLMQSATDPVPLIATGCWEGSILMAPQGKHGFGYDPIFYVPSHQCSAAELNASVKNTISHRGKALHALINKIAV